MKEPDALAISQVNRRVAMLRKALPEAGVRLGWIRYMRQALGLTLKQLARRVGVTTATTAQAERGEAQGKVTIATLKMMAQAMECEFMYAFVPKSDIQDLMKEAARKKARLLLESADVHMTLEDQKVNQSLEERVERLAEKFFKKGDVW